MGLSTTTWATQSQNIFTVDRLGHGMECRKWILKSGRLATIKLAEARAKNYGVHFFTCFNIFPLLYPLL